MLTRLRFKNWRSLRDVVIDDLQPINVFIGANSSGKTNIIDALRFHRDTHQKGLVEVVLELGYTRIQTDAMKQDGRVELEFTYRLADIAEELITETLILEFDKRDVPFNYGHKLVEGNTLLQDDKLHELPARDVIRSSVFGITNEYNRSRKILRYLGELIPKRWQILGDNFVPPLRLSSREGGSPYVIEPDARNLLLILSFMRQSYPELYENLLNDLRWLLSHVSELRLWQQREDRELKLLVDESVGRTAPTVSNGTARLIAMLTAIYALDMDNPPVEGLSEDMSRKYSEMPSLVVIEEPDTALNPHLFKRFVEQIRNYVEGEHPRQVILTTHNPQLLDYFQPEEVRIVERDEQGYTTVNRVPEHIKDIWLDKYTLGEVWMTRSLGGVPE